MPQINKTAVVAWGVCWRLQGNASTGGAAKTKLPVIGRCSQKCIAEEIGAILVAIAVVARLRSKGIWSGADDCMVMKIREKRELRSSFQKGTEKLIYDNIGRSRTKKFVYGNQEPAI